jgi:hypothetical protein
MHDFRVKGDARSDRFVSTGASRRPADLLTYWRRLMFFLLATMADRPQAVKLPPQAWSGERCYEYLVRLGNSVAA